MTLITYEQAQRLNGGELEAQQRAVMSALRRLSRSSLMYRDDRINLERASRILARAIRERSASG